MNDSLLSLWDCARPCAEELRMWFKCRREQREQEVFWKREFNGKNTSVFDQKRMKESKRQMRPTTIKKQDALCKRNQSDKALLLSLAAKMILNKDTFYFILHSFHCFIGFDSSIWVWDGSIAKVCIFRVYKISMATFHIKWKSKRVWKTFSLSDQRESGA